jgi:hypothetical protein
MQHPASKLLFCGYLEVDPRTKEVPHVHVLNIQTINNPLVVVRDFHPIFTKSNKICELRSKKEEKYLPYIIMKPRRDWSILFQSMIRNNFGKRKSVVPDFSKYYD